MVLWEKKVESATTLCWREEIKRLKMLAVPMCLWIVSRWWSLEQIYLSDVELPLITSPLLLPTKVCVCVWTQVTLTLPAKPLCNSWKERTGHHPILEGTQLSFCESDAINSHPICPHTQAWLSCPCSRTPWSLLWSQYAKCTFLALPVVQVYLCSRAGWMGFWATWTSGRCPCPWKVGWDSMTVKGSFQPQTILTILWSFCDLWSGEWRHRVGDGH